MMIKEIITRADDCGANSSSTRAIAKAVETKFIKNISFMAVGRDIENAANLLKDKKNLCFGLHFTVFSEWEGIKWMPKETSNHIKTLVTQDGNFYQGPEEWKNNKEPSIEELHLEWCAQLDFLTKLGIHVQYCDTHMFPEYHNKMLFKEMKQWIKKKGLIDHTPFYNVLPRMSEYPNDLSVFEDVLHRLGEGQYFYLAHPSYSGKDMLKCWNKDIDAGELSKQRKKELDFVSNPQVLKMCQEAGVSCIRYDQAKEERGVWGGFEKWNTNM